MSILKTTAAVLVSGLLIGAVGPASSASAQQSQQPSTPSAAAQSNSSPAVLSILGMIIPQVEHEVSQCTTSLVYSQHDVVGDPQSCFANVVDAPSGETAVVSAP